MVVGKTKLKRLERSKKPKQRFDRLLELPVEIVEHIIRFVSDNYSLLKIAFTNNHVLALLARECYYGRMVDEIERLFDAYEVTIYGNKLVMYRATFFHPFYKHIKPANEKDELKRTLLGLVRSAITDKTAWLSVFTHTCEITPRVKYPIYSGRPELNNSGISFTVVLVRSSLDFLVNLQINNGCRFVDCMITPCHSYKPKSKKIRHYLAHEISCGEGSIDYGKVPPLSNWFMLHHFYDTTGDIILTTLVDVPTRFKLGNPELFYNKQGYYLELAMPLMFSVSTPKNGDLHLFTVSPFTQPVGLSILDYYSQKYNNMAKGVFYREGTIPGQQPYLSGLPPFSFLCVRTWRDDFSAFNKVPPLDGLALHSRDFVKNHQKAYKWLPTDKSKSLTYNLRRLYTLNTQPASSEARLLRSTDQKSSIDMNVEKLRFLTLSDYYNLKRFGKNMYDLRLLDLRECKDIVLECEAFAHLKSLRVLLLGEVSRSSPNALKGLDNLRYLYLSNVLLPIHCLPALDTLAIDVSCQHPAWYVLFCGHEKSLSEKIAFDRLIDGVEPDHFNHKNVKTLYIRCRSGFPLSCPSKIATTFYWIPSLQQIIYISEYNELIRVYNRQIFCSVNLTRFRTYPLAVTFPDCKAAIFYVRDVFWDVIFYSSDLSPIGMLLESLNYRDLNLRECIRLQRRTLRANLKIYPLRNINVNQFAMACSNTPDRYESLFYDYLY